MLKTDTTYKMVRLTAEDWYSYNCQEDCEREFEVGVVEIVGFLVKETDKYITVTMEIFTSHENDIRKTITIPKGCIKSIKEIK